jgi:glycosyltransferase involved in cell wall biosynthesis
LRIALATPAYWPEVRRGSERVVHDLGVALARRGHDVTVLTFHAGSPSSDMEDGVRVARAWRPPAPPLLRSHEYHVQTIPATIGRLLQGNFELVHAFFPTDAWAAVQARRLGGPPVVFSMHGIPKREYLVARRYRLEMFHQIVARAEACTVLSEAAADAFRRYLLADPLVLPPGVFCDEFAWSGARAGEPTVVCAASLGDPRKRGDLLMAAFRELRGDARHVKLAVVRGSDPFLAGTEEPRLAPGADWIEADGTDLLARFYGSAWASVLPAVDEAFGLVLVESLAAGTPVVAARSGAASEIVDDQDVGRLFEPDDPHDLARAMREALELGSRAETAEACRRRAADYDWSRAIEPHEALYESVLRSRP